MLMNVSKKFVLRRSESWQSKVTSQSGSSLHSAAITLHCSAPRSVDRLQLDIGSMRSHVLLQAVISLL